MLLREFLAVCDFRTVHINVFGGSGLRILDFEIDNDPWVQHLPYNHDVYEIIEYDEINNATVERFYQNLARKPTDFSRGMNCCLTNARMTEC